ncbi:MAG: helix-turn-helix transcriptional regulator [bacterium]
MDNTVDIISNDLKNKKRQFGKNLKKLRLKSGVTQEKLAELTGLSVVYVGYLEQGKNNPSLEVIYRLADALGVEAGELLKD